MQPIVPARSRTVAFGLSALLFAAGAWAAPADTVFIGDNIVTLRETGKAAGDRAGEQEEPTALAINDDRIVWMGPSLEAKAWIGTETEVIDLKNNALLPGFIDAHGHLLFSASTLDFANVSSPPVGEVTNFKSLQQTLRRHIKEKQIPKGEWVIGFSYDDSLLRENRHPEKEDLDAASSEHPVVLLHVSGHLFAANNLALSRVGYTAASADPEGGHIRRKPGSREPNGVLEETATMPLWGAAQLKWSADLIERTLAR
ncbi:MAG: amidohydrolase family protein [Gammaproteobacteria bacterium]|nr:amidohydrolase family protein [Gammaproteobacteria bacterium]